MNETAYALYESAEQLGLRFVLMPFGRGVRLRKPFDLAALPTAYEKLNDQQRLSFWHDFLRDNPMTGVGGEENA